jgi:transcriptional regulator of acetoin/glycerol metabolism
VRRGFFLWVLLETNCNYHDAARRLQITRSTLYSKIRRYSLEKVFRGIKENDQVQI